MFFVVLFLTCVDENSSVLLHQDKLQTLPSMIERMIVMMIAMIIIVKQ